ncbi:hypothetical protein ACFL2J_06940 [Candidatus Omnitrophota bacterium]
MKPITISDFMPGVYAWTKVSKYAITEEGYLIRYDGQLSDGFPVYQCLYEGWWEATDACVGIREVREAELISLKAAQAIIRKEEKPLEQRPKERRHWLSC